ncbi:outer membrane beta-barrel protein [Belliella pelovolcani]|uniref:outer membrane beta-barrel protein n=1 Tax=Belliella pelovolcani TaxID=529505 RepID=UPI00391D7A17
MKRGLLLFVLLCCGFAAKSQTEKGKLLFGASTSFGLGEANTPMTIGFSSSELKFEDGSTVEVKNSNIYFAPKVGYFILDNLALGLNLAASFSNGETTQAVIEVENKSNLFAIGPFARYYFTGDKIRPFTELSSLFGLRNEKNQVGTVTTDNKYSLTSISGGLGMAVLLGERSSLDFMASYNSFKLRESEDSFINRQKTIGIKLGFTFFIR